MQRNAPTPPTPTGAVRALLPPEREGDQVQLIRHGSARVYAVTSAGRPPLVARVTNADTFAPSCAQQRLARYLGTCGVQVGEPAEDLVPSGTIGQFAVTFWRVVAHDPAAAPDPGATGAALARLHQVRAPAWLGPFDPLAFTRSWWAAVLREASAAEADVLTRALSAGELLWDRVRADAGPTGILHGDVPGNVLCTSEGPVLIDWESAGTGPLAWDLAKVSRMGHTPAQLTALICGYTRSGGAGTLSAAAGMGPLVILAGAAFAVMKRPQGAVFAAESHVRMATLRGDPGPVWATL